MRTTWHGVEPSTSKFEITEGIPGVSPKPPVYTLVDRERICQVATNLMSNAVKFTPNGGSISRELREHQVTPHVAQKPNSAIDGRTTRRPGYLLSQRRRKWVGEIFGWLKTVGGLRKTCHRGVA